MLEMAEVSAMNSDNRESFGELVAKEDEDGIKKEPEVSVKPEPQECAVCVARSGDCLGIYTARTSCGTSLNDFLCKFTHRDLVTSSSKHVCKSCFDLINIFEQTELEYFKLKETFESIISKNPLFEQTEHCQSNVGTVKIELSEELSFKRGSKDDSEDEPLSLTKKKRHRKVVKRKKKVYSATKRKPRAKASEDSWEYPVEIEIPDPESPSLCDVKKEASPDRTESLLNNGLDKLFKMEIGDYDDDDNSSNYIPDEISNGEKKRSNFSVGRPRKNKLIPMQKIRKKRERVVHQCDQCDAKYTSLRRLEAHKEKHEDGKPPYICEVCGARYKHKRACDIHVALHKGISDWKCDECNKLFPSKGALQRHNNIHTGKLNYQCDLCGKSFIHTSSFKMHKLSHSGVKPHACDVCGLALMTRSHLKRHKRIHSGEKRHECGVCGKRFSERYNLVAHGKAHEGAPALAQAAPRRRLFRCPYCPERFERRYMLERHTAAAHGRTLERAPPTPRNTMSKLLKAQAASCGTGTEVTETKEERSPDSRASTTTPHKIQLSSTSTITAGSWSGAYAAEFGLRDYQH